MKENEKAVLAPITITSRLGSDTVIERSSLTPEVQTYAVLQSLTRVGIALSSSVIFL